MVVMAAPGVDRVVVILALANVILRVKIAVNTDVIPHVMVPVKENVKAVVMIAQPVAPRVVARVVIMVVVENAVKTARPVVPGLVTLNVSEVAHLDAQVHVPVVAPEDVMQVVKAHAKEDV